MYIVHFVVLLQSIKYIYITYAGDGHDRFTVTLGISLTMPNKK